MKKFVLLAITGIVLGVGTVTTLTANAEMNTRQISAGSDGLSIRGETRFNPVLSWLETRSAATATQNGANVSANAFMLTPGNARLHPSGWVTGRTQITARSGFTSITATRPGGEMR